jgi:hypothetical protein
MIAANIQMIANGELVSGAAIEDRFCASVGDPLFTISYRALSPGTHLGHAMTVRDVAKRDAPSGNGMRSPAFTDSVGSTLFVTLRRLGVGCCSQSYDASIAVTNGALTLLPCGTRTIWVDLTQSREFMV